MNEERVVLVGGEFDGQEVADSRRLPEYVMPVEGSARLRLVVYGRTQRSDSVGRHIYQYRRVED